MQKARRFAAATEIKPKKSIRIVTEAPEATDPTGDALKPVIARLEALEHRPPKPATNGDDKRSGTPPRRSSPSPNNRAPDNRPRGYTPHRESTPPPKANRWGREGRDSRDGRDDRSFGNRRSDRSRSPSPWRTEGNHSPGVGYGYVTRAIIAGTVLHRPGRIDHVTTTDGTQAYPSGWAPRDIDSSPQASYSSWGYSGSDRPRSLPTGASQPNPARDLRRKGCFICGHPKCHSYICPQRQITSADGQGQQANNPSPPPQPAQPNFQPLGDFPPQGDFPAPGNCH